MTDISSTIQGHLEYNLETSRVLFKGISSAIQGHLEYYLEQRNNFLIWQHLNNYLVFIRLVTFIYTFIYTFILFIIYTFIYTFILFIISRSTIVQRASKYRHFCLFFFFFQVSKSFCLIPVILSFFGFILFELASHGILALFVFSRSIKKLFFS